MKCTFRFSLSHFRCREWSQFLVFVACNLLAYAQRCLVVSGLWPKNPVVRAVRRLMTYGKLDPLPRMETAAIRGHPYL